MVKMSRTKLVLIGIDGCSFNILKPLVKDGCLPTFEEIMKEGCHSPLISTLPFNTLPAWTSIFTGVNPGKHGITDGIIRENGQYKFVNYKYRMVDSLWAILNRYGLNQIIVNEPVTYPPEKINGIMLTGFLTPPQSKNFAHPQSIMDEINKVCHNYEPDLPLGFEEVIAKDKNEGFRMISSFAEKIFQAAMYLAKNYDWDMLSITFTSTDRLQHFYFYDSKYIREHYQLLDKFINTIISIENEANVIIVSDHGFGPLNKFFFVNTWLKDQNLVVENKSILNALFPRLGLTYKKLVSTLTKMRLYKLVSKVTPMSIKRSIPLNTFDSVLDFSKSLVFSLSSPNGGLFVNNTSFGKDQFSSLIEKLSLLTVNGEKLVENLYLRKDVMWGPYTYRAADIFLIPKYGYEISHRLAPIHLSTPETFDDIRTGTHRPQGVFIAYGTDISKGAKLKEPLFTWDIAPIILHMLNLSIPNYMDGHVKKEIFKKGSELAIKPIKYKYISECERISTRLKMLRAKR